MCMKTTFMTMEWDIQVDNGKYTKFWAAFEVNHLNWDTAAALSASL